MAEKVYPIITISREFASGGHSIAIKVAEELGIPFVDKEIAAKICEESGYTKEFVKEKGKYVNGKEQFLNSFLLSNTIGYYENPQDVVFNMQRKAILERAQEPCVIVGRCADYILEKKGVDILKVFIHASKEYRIARTKSYGDTGVDIEKRLNDMDKQRKAYYRYYTEMEWGEYQNYHLNLDSGYLTQDECVKIICDAAKNHMIEK